MILTSSPRLASSIKRGFPQEIPSLLQQETYGKSHESFLLSAPTTKIRPRYKRKETMPEPILKKGMIALQWFRVGGKKSLDILRKADGLGLEYRRALKYDTRDYGFACSIHVRER
ncbi:hypothetical protein AVEN_17235-1 [Araneus ventricosus]|uniref:Uncharacterized protein n=1 Tax=Araneus ventricosus TaxID=182803 RepID=A0A4Y2FLV0_ARAVE|nr:hypothetical protein AVEN_17235-1 [Araneus ventricosus]